MPYTIIICGSRAAKAQHVYTAMAKFMAPSSPTEPKIHPSEISEIISGMALGADTWACSWAERFGISLKKFPADWSTFGKQAGLLRNQQMLDYLLTCESGDKNSLWVVAAWDGQSRGTTDMVARAQKAGVQVLVHNYGLSASTV